MDNKSDDDIEQQQSSWLLSRAGIIVMLFVVLGPFGLGLLRRSKCFSRNAKIFLTIATLTYTGIIMGIFVALMMYVYRLFNQFLSTF